jgi:hypothetical protein
MDAFRAEFPGAEELGLGLCSMRRCTSPYLFAPGVLPQEVAGRHETWGPALQEIPLDTPVRAGTPVATRCGAQRC